PDHSNKSNTFAKQAGRELLSTFPRMVASGGEQAIATMLELYSEQDATSLENLVAIEVSMEDGSSSIAIQPDAYTESSRAKHPGDVTYSEVSKGGAHPSASRIVTIDLILPSLPPPAVPSGLMPVTSTIDNIPTVRLGDTVCLLSLPASSSDKKVAQGDGKNQ